MDLKFTFGGASPDHHDHGDAPSGIPLPFSSGPGLSTSSVLEARVRRSSHTLLIGEVVTGDGVVYTTAEVALVAPPTGAPEAEAAALARGVRSALSRAVAGLEGPLAASIQAVRITLGGSELAALAALGITPVNDALSTDDAMQRRSGIPAGTPITVTAQ